MEKINKIKCHKLIEKYKLNILTFNLSLLNNKE
jgi:hypothetical protein